MSAEAEQLADVIAERVAERVAELVEARLAELVERRSAGSELIDAAEVARRFGVGRDYVYEHADRLGAVRLGDGPRARLRFDPARVTEALAGDEPEPAPSRSRRRQRRPNGGVPLLPIRGARP